MRVSRYFEEACVVKFAQSAASLLLLLCSHGRSPRAYCCAACDRSRDTLKPERRWCHGPDVKRARWPVALLLFPPSTTTNRANRGCTQTHRPRAGAATALKLIKHEFTFRYRSRAGSILYMRFTYFLHTSKQWKTAWKNMRRSMAVEGISAKPHGRTEVTAHRRFKVAPLFIWDCVQAGQ